MERICHVTSAHPPEDGRIFRRACQSTVNAGYETFLIQPGDSYEKNGIHIVGLGNPAKPGRLYRMTSFAKKAYERALDVNADLYHLHDPELLPFALKLKKHGKAVVFDSHENYVEQIRNKPYLPGKVAAFASKLYDQYSKRVFAKIDGLTYAGNGETATIFDNMCLRVVPTDNYPWLSELYDKYDDTVEKEKGTACYVGGLDEVRGITQIIKACYQAGCKLYLAGNFHSDSYKSKVMNMEEYACVDYLGVIDRDAIYSLMQKVEIGLCTLLDVGQYYKMVNLPTKIYEYMSMGLPVIMNDSEYNIIVNKKLSFGICVDPYNQDILCEAVKKLLSDSALRTQMGENGRRAIKEKYSWDSAQIGLIEMYKSILKDRAR